MKNVKQTRVGPGQGEGGCGAQTGRAEPLLDQRRYDQPPLGLLTLAVCLDVVPALEVLVNYLALERAHRLERHRTTIVDRRLRSLIRRSPERDGAALAITSSVNHHTQGFSGAAECNPVGQVLDRVDRLAVMADQESEILADKLSRETFGVLAELDRRIDPDSVGNLLEHLPDASGSVRRLARHR